MEKEFVPYEESLELKELGFDEPCFARYDGRGKHKGKIWYEMPNTGQDSIPVGDVLAPTFSQAFRWFRKKGYDVKVEKESAEVYFGFWWTGVAWSLIESGTYEEAELTCLRKLIQIVKEK